jgi:SnoaL-like domain
MDQAALANLVALEEIRRLKHRYLRCVDLKLWDELADTFTPEATANYGTGGGSRTPATPAPTR